jgi:hypothetical protein
MTGDDPMYENAYKKPVHHYWVEGERCVCGDTWPCEEIQAMWDDIDPPVTPRPKLSHPQLMALVVTPVNGWYEYHYSVGPTEEPDEEGEMVPNGPTVAFKWAEEDEPLRLDERLRNVREMRADGPPVEPTNHHAELAEKLRNLRVIRPDGPPLTFRELPPERYRSAHGDLQPWDICEAFGLDFFEGAALKYLLRYKKKGGREDLDKLIHYATRLREQWDEGLRGLSTD